MALARKCDRCKKLYEHYPIDDNTKKYNAIKLEHLDNKNIIKHSSKTIDICPTCLAELLRFFNGYAVSDDLELIRGVSIF